MPTDTPSDARAARLLAQDCALVADLISDALAVPRWRNLWFLANPPGTMWSQYTHPSRQAAEQAGRENLDEIKVWLAAYGDDFFDAPFDWLRVSRVRCFIPMPDPKAP